MKSKNINGFYSGGYQYDKLDRFAQQELLESVKFKYQFTKYGFIKHKRKLFNKTDNCKLDYIKQFGKRKFFVKASLYLECENLNPVASAWFLFVGKDHIKRKAKK